MKWFHLTVCFLFSMLFAACESTVRDTLDISGIWSFQLDSLGVGEQQKWFSNTLTGFITLPGTIDNQQKGILNENRNETSNLSKEYYYIGKAWYSKTIEIPSNWLDKHIELVLERTKPTRLWVDGAFAGSSDDISTKQVYDLTEQLTPGIHKLTIMVDNGESVPVQVIANSHAYSESTQTNWNGIIGNIQLEAKPQVYITDLQVHTNLRANNAIAQITLNKVPKLQQIVDISILGNSYNTNKRHQLKWQKEVILTSNVVSVEFPLSDDYLAWSEFSPNLYKLNISIKGENIKDNYTLTLGIRDFSVKDTQFTINELTTYLRGKHDGCVFPLTAHTAMDVDTWRHYFQVAKEYGLNHFRFHSWCPPEACFEAADLEGIYLQPELPIWGSLNEKDTMLTNFLLKEGLHIQKQYGNHASFVMMGLGNEMSGDSSVMEYLIKEFKAADGRHLFSSGSNNYLGYQGYNEWDDYFTTCRLPGDNSLPTHTRGSFSFADVDEGGYINTVYPNAMMNFDPAVVNCAVPIISHETGQFQIYPDYNQIKKYTGNLKAWNLEVFKKRLEDAGMASLAKDFFEASGKWAVELYRADIEMDLRTNKFGGFQLLDLQDYPGQGSAYVGILDAFMDSKGLITPEKWREFCCEVVPLLILPKYTYTSNELLKAEVKVSNFSDMDLKGKKLTWQLTYPNGQVLDQGTLNVNAEQGTLTSLGTIEPRISNAKAPVKYTLTLKIDGTNYQNSYPIWLYDTPYEIEIPENVTVTHSLDRATLQALKDGKNVLLFPNHEKYKDITVSGLFQTDYWNYRMFNTVSERNHRPVSPGTLGILTNPDHPIFKKFPTEEHTNWQWFPIIKHSRPLIINQLPTDYKPIVQVIDNIERNQKLGLILELAVDKGKLLVCMSDLESVQDYPEGRQCYQSILDYMNSDAFNPSCQLTLSDLLLLFSSSVGNNGMKSLDNISY